MKKHSHNFVEEYAGFVGFGLDRTTDERTVAYFLQKFSDDELMRAVLPRFSNEQLEEVFTLVSKLLKEHLDEPEYHRLFMKE